MDTNIVVRTGDVFVELAKMSASSVHVIITSMPYWGLRLYSHGRHARREVGQEDCLESYIGAMSRWLEACRRVLRPDGTLWMVAGDTYTDDTKFPKAVHKRGSNRITGLPRRSLLGMPWRIALAALNTGWAVRSEIIIHNPTAPPSGDTDRPATAHQTMFVLSKSNHYYYDDIGSADPASSQVTIRSRKGKQIQGGHETLIRGNARLHESMALPTNVRRLRSVWTIPINKSPDDLPPATSHHARFTLNLPMKILTAAISERGCCADCKKQYERIVVRRKRMVEDRLTVCYDSVGWKRRCKCATHEVDRPTVLDTFSGSGTTLVAAHRSNCHAIGLELNPTYAKESRLWLQHERKRRKSLAS